MKTICLLAAFFLSATSALLAVAPDVTTEAADHILPTSAVLHADMVDLHGVKADLSFEYGTTSWSLDKETIVRKNAAPATTSFQIPVTKLTAGTKYFFRAKAKNTDGTSFGGELSFTTTAGGGVPTLTPRVVAVVGQPVANDANGATYAKLKLAEGPFGGKMLVGKTKVPAIFAGDGSVRAKVGDGAPLIPDSVIVSLGDPSGDAALAKLKPNAGAVTAQDNQIILAGLRSGSLRVAARTNVELTNATGVSIKNFGAIDGNGSVIFFLATLQGANVPAKSALCAALADGSVRVLAQVGQQFGTTTIKTIAVLIGLKGTLAEGRWRSGEDHIDARTTTADGVHHVCVISSTSIDATDWLTLMSTGDALSAPVSSEKIHSLGLPGSADDIGFGAPAMLEIGSGGIEKTNDAALIRFSEAGLTVIAQEGSDAPDATGLTPLTGATFKSFGPLVAGPPAGGVDGIIAFTATLFGAKGAASNGIWLKGSEDPQTLSIKPLTLLARGGDDAPGGGKFASFSTLALPNGTKSGPIFTGKLAVDKDAGITAANNLGIWAVNTTGVLIGLLRTGDKIAGVAGQTRTIKSFTALVPAAGSIGAANGYDDAGKLAALVTFTDKTIALVEFTIP